MLPAGRRIAARIGAGLTGSERARHGLERFILVMLVLAFTLPFIGQAVHHDAQLDIDWAKQQLEHPLWQHIPEYDYFGFHFDEFHDTHPRLQSFYLSQFIRLGGGVSEILLHASMLPFPIIAALSMYSLSRRFKVNAFVATLLLLVAPAFLVNTHLIMKDVPGLALWLAGLALFIAGVDRDRLPLMVLGGISFTLSIFIFYQGLSALPLAFLYLVLKRKLDARSIMSLSIPVILFSAFVSAHFASYGTVPNYTYPEPIGLPVHPYLIAIRIRGLLTIIGGTALLPALGLVLFARKRSAFYVAAGMYVITLLWVAVFLFFGAMAIEHLLLLPLFLASGVAIVWWFLSRFASDLRPALMGRGDSDTLFLSTWVIGVLFYCSFLMPYASPRFMLPLLPPLAIVAARLMQERWGAVRERYVRMVTWIAMGTFVLAMLIAVGEHQRANYGPEQAELVHREIERSTQGTVWYAGYLGFQYYIEPYGYRMLIVDRNEPVKGDIIVETLYNGRWPFEKDLLKRLVLERKVDFARNWPITTFNVESGTAWIGMLDLFMPYGISGDFVDRLYVYRVVCDHGQEWDEDASECKPAEEDEESEDDDKDGYDNGNNRDLEDDSGPRRTN